MSKGASELVVSAASSVLASLYAREVLEGHFFFSFGLPFLSSTCLFRAAHLVCLLLSLKEANMSYAWCLEGKMKERFLYMRCAVFFLCSFAHLYEGSMKSCKNTVSFLLQFLVPCFHVQKLSEMSTKNYFFEGGMLLVISVFN